MLKSSAGCFKSNSLPLYSRCIAADIEMNYMQYIIIISVEIVLFLMIVTLLIRYYNRK